MSSKEKGKFIFVALVVALICIGILPVFFPPWIMDYSRVNWMGTDLAQDITGDEGYFNDTFPSFKNVSNLNAYDLRGKSYEAKLALTTLQGLANRDNASLYLIYRDTDLHWLNQLNESHGINYTILSLPSFLDVIDLYNSSIEGLIIYDENLLDTVNVGTFLAGLYNCVVIRSAMLADFSTWGLDINNVTFDLRNRFRSKVELYSWAWTNFQQNATKKMVCSLDPEQTHFRDYIIATKMFTFFLAGGPFGPAEEVNLFKSILSQYPANIPVFGWFSDPGGAMGEYEAVKIISKSGKYSLCAAIPDMTVFSSIQETSLKQKTVAFDPSNYTLENKIYVTVVVSDGDNVNFCGDGLYKLWQDPNQGTVPVGITLEPAMFKFFPTCLKFYYENATPNDYFMAGPSGAGYCYVNMNPAFPSFLNHTKYAMDQSDMQQVWLLNGYEPFQIQYSNEILNAYTSRNCNFSGIYVNYHDFPAELNYLINDVPVFQSVWVEQENELVGKLLSLRLASPHAPVFVFVGFNAWDFSFTKLKGAVDQLGADFVFLRPDHFAQLYAVSQLPAETRLIIEWNMFFWTALLPLIGVVGALFLIWGVYKKDDKPPNEKGEPVKSVINKAIFFSLDFLFLLIIRYYFFSTFLNLFSFMYFLIAIMAGMFLKKYIDRVVGVRENLILSIGTLSVGIILFIFNPKFTIIAGFSMGMLLAHQIQSHSSLFHNRATGKKEFLYNMIIASTIILLVPPEYYFVPLIIAIIASCGISGTCIFYLIQDIQDEKPQISLQTSVKYWYPSGVLLGLLLMLLMAPTFSPERLFFHLFWGIGFFPTRLTLSFNLAALYLGAILLSEVLQLRDIQISKKYTLVLAVPVMILYIFMPIFLNGMPFFILSNFLFIFWMYSCCNLMLGDAMYTTTESYEDRSKVFPNSASLFTIQLAFWVLIGVFLTFTFPAILIVDNQGLFADFGMIGISQLSWPSIVWAIFYIPTVYLFLVIPITVFVLIVGIVSFFF